jgi:hypothetical protein
MLLGCAGIMVARSHETDNYSLPLDVELADLGDYLEAVHTRALEEAVAEVNARIERAARIGDESTRARKLARVQDPDALVAAFLGRFSHPMLEDSQLERALGGRWARGYYAGSIASHQDLGLYFSAYAPLDLRRWAVLTQCRTIRAYGTYFGTDKLVHFHWLGAYYYKRYRALLKDGLSAEEAYSRVLAHYSRRGVLSERALFGMLGTGIYSNADLAVNHVGFKFLMNLTEKVLVKGKQQEPLILRSGLFWRLNPHVRPRSGWFAVFISDHWNEALNPSRYAPSLRNGVRRALRHRAREIVEFYTERDGRPCQPEYFDGLARELSTYYGESYGHSGSLEELLTIGNTCLPALSGRCWHPSADQSRSEMPRKVVVVLPRVRVGCRFEEVVDSAEESH